MQVKQNISEVKLTSGEILKVGKSYREAVESLL